MLEHNSVEIKTGEVLKLICVAYSEDVRWSFRHRTGNRSITINSTSNILTYVNVSFAAHDGLYNCSTTTDYQVNFLHSIQFEKNIFFETFEFVFR